MQKTHIDRLLFRKLLATEGGCCLPLPRGYIHAWGHYFQASSFKRLGKSVKFCAEPPFGKGYKNLYKHDLGHITELAAMPIYSKTVKSEFFRTRRWMISKLGMGHRGFNVYKIIIWKAQGVPQ